MRFLVVFLSMMTIAFHSHAQENQELVRYYDSSVITIHYGFSGISLSYQGKTSPSAYGVSESMEMNLCKYESSKKHYSNYQTTNFLGKILAAGGFAALMIGLSQVFSENSSQVANTKTLGYVGLTSAVLGSLLIQSGYNELFLSINEHNREKMRNYRQ